MKLGFVKRHCEFFQFQFVPFCLMLHCFTIFIIFVGFC
jgi:hypothetical protein